MVSSSVSVADMSRNPDTLRFSLISIWPYENGEASSTPASVSLSSLFITLGLNYRAFGKTLGVSPFSILILATWMPISGNWHAIGKIASISTMPLKTEH